MLEKFTQTMLKMSLLGFNQSTLTNCSDVIPISTGTVSDPFLPAGLTMDDIVPACDSTPFPTLSTVAGEQTMSSSRLNILILKWCRLGDQCCGGLSTWGRSRYVSFAVGGRTCGGSFSTHNFISSKICFVAFDENMYITSGCFCRLSSLPCFEMYGIDQWMGF